MDGIPHFHVFAADGTVLNPNARGLVDALGVDAYPWYVACSTQLAPDLPCADCFRFGLGFRRA